MHDLLALMHDLRVTQSLSIFSVYELFLYIDIKNKFLKNKKYIIKNIFLKNKKYIILIHFRS
jgi:hypothetical protein